MACVTVLTVALVQLISFAVTAEAKDRKPVDTSRDGSNYERAILIPKGIGEDKYVHWEWQYLGEHYPDRGFPMQHALTQHNGGMFDVHTFSTSQGKKEVYFDITRIFKEWQRKHPNTK